MSSESYEICNNYQIYSPGEIWTIYFSNVKTGDTITFENYYTIYKQDGVYKIDNGGKITNTFGVSITFPNSDPPPCDGNTPACGTNTDQGRCYLIEDLIPQASGVIHTSPDTIISMNNFADNGMGNNCQTNNFTINYAPSGVNTDPIAPPYIPNPNNWIPSIVNQCENSRSLLKGCYNCRNCFNTWYDILKRRVIDNFCYSRKKNYIVYVIYFLSFIFVVRIISIRNRNIK